MCSQPRQQSSGDLFGTIAASRNQSKVPSFMYSIFGQKEQQPNPAQNNTATQPEPTVLAPNPSRERQPFAYADTQKKTLLGA